MLTTREKPQSADEAQGSPTLSDKNNNKTVFGTPVSLTNSPPPLTQESAESTGMPPFVLEEPALSASNPNVVLHTRTDSSADLQELEEEQTEPPTSGWIGNRDFSVNESLYNIGIAAIREPRDQRTPSTEDPVTATTFKFGSSEFEYAERSIIEQKFTDKATVKAFGKADLLKGALETLAGKYKPTKLTMTAPVNRLAAITDALTSFLHPRTFIPLIKSKKKRTDQPTDSASTAHLKEEQPSKNIKKASSSKRSQTSTPSILSIIQGYIEDELTAEKKETEKNSNTTIIYKPSKEGSYAPPLVFLPHLIRKEDVNHQADYVGLKVSTSISGGKETELKVEDIAPFRRFVIACCMFGTSIVGRDNKGGKFPIIKHEIELFDDQLIESIQVAKRSFYEEAQFKIFKTIALMMQQIGDKKEYQFHLKSRKPTVNDMIENQIYLYEEQNEIFYTLQTGKGLINKPLKKSDFKNPSHFDNLLTLLMKPNIDQESINDSLHAELRQILIKKNDNPKDFEVVCHLPYIDYILFGVRLYVEGKMTLNALEAFCVAVLNKKDELSKRLHEVFPKELGIELVIAQPLDNLLNAKELHNLLKGKKRNRTHNDMSISRFVLTQLGIKPLESNAPSTPDKKEHDTQQTAQEVEVKQTDTVNRCLELLMTNTHNPIQAIIWRDFIAAARKMNTYPTTLEDLLKIGNVVVLGMADYNMQLVENPVATDTTAHKVQPLQVCSIQPFSERPIQTTFDKYSQSINEHDLYFIELPEGEALESKHAILKKTAEEKATPILIKKGNTFSVFGVQNNEWQERPLMSLSAKEIATLTKLNVNPNDPFIKKDALKPSLLAILKKAHTPNYYPPVFLLTHMDLLMAYQHNDKKGNQVRAGIAFYYDDYELGATDLIGDENEMITKKSHKHFLLNALRNGAFAPSHPAHTPLTYDLIKRSPR